MSLSRKSQQRECDVFRHDFNHHRPHEALGMKVPGDVYRRSAVEFPREEQEVEYPERFHVRLVSSTGCLKHHDTPVFVSSTLAGRHVGLERIGRGRVYALWFAQHRIGEIDFTEDRAVLRQWRPRAA